MCNIVSTITYMHVIYLRICIQNFKQLLEIIVWSECLNVLLCHVMSLYWVTPRSHPPRSHPQGKEHVELEGDRPYRCFVWSIVSCFCRLEHTLRWGRSDQHHQSPVDLQNDIIVVTSILEYSLFAYYTNFITKDGEDVIHTRIKEKVSYSSHNIMESKDVIGGPYISLHAWLLNEQQCHTNVWQHKF